MVETETVLELLAKEKMGRRMFCVAAADQPIMSPIGGGGSATFDLVAHQSTGEAETRLFSTCQFVTALLCTILCAARLGDWEQARAQ